MKPNETPVMKPVSLEQLLREEKTHVDLYVQLSERKYVLVGKAGTNTSSLARYRDRRVQYLHVRSDDLVKLLQQSMSVAGIMLNKENVSDQAKIVALEHALTSVHRNFESFGFNEQTVAHARVVTEATMTMCLNHNELQRLVNQISLLKDPANRQAILTSALCSMIGVAMGYTMPATLEKLALGGFLLDIGKTKLPRDVTDKPVEKLTKAETDIYKSHVDLGMNMAQAIRDLPYDVTLMIYEHHECADGSGYPRKIKDLLMSPLGRIGIVANAFAEQVLRENEEMKRNDADLVIDYMMNQTPHLYNREVLKALKILIGERRAAARAG